MEQKLHKWIHVLQCFPSSTVGAEVELLDIHLYFTILYLISSRELHL